MNGSVLSRLCLCPKLVPLLIFVVLSCAVRTSMHKSYCADIIQVTVSWVQRKLSKTRKTSTKESRATSWGKGDRRGWKINPMYSQFVKVGKSGKPTQRSHKGTHQNKANELSPDRDRGGLKEVLSCITHQTSSTVLLSLPSNLMLCDAIHNAKRAKRRQRAHVY